MTWLINGTTINEIFAPATPPMAISVSTETLNDAAVSVLTIGALLKYDETVVMCQANFLSPNLEVEVCNTSAVLLIKGE